MSWDIIFHGLLAVMIIGLSMLVYWVGVAQMAFYEALEGTLMKSGDNVTFSSVPDYRSRWQKIAPTWLGGKPAPVPRTYEVI